MEDLKYGLQNGKLVHISKVRKGLDCNCLCPSCKSPLVAKKGSYNVPHFAHYRVSDCKHGTETALHMMAKSIVAEQKKLFVPYTTKNVYGDSDGGRIFSFENAVIEKQLSATVRSDVLLSINDRLLNVEIRVTHGVDENKIVELFNLGIPTIEIDLREIKSNFDENLIEKLLLSGLCTKLIFTPKAKDIFAKQLLGEWKKIHINNYGFYVEDCPHTHERAYCVDYSFKGGPTECHECYGGSEHDWDRKYMLCRDVLGNLDFESIDKILCIKKEGKHLTYVKLLLKDGNVFEKHINL